MSTVEPSLSRPIRVAHVIQNLNYGGMERVLSDLVQLSSSGQFEFHVVVLEYFGRFASGLDRHATLHLAPRMSRLSLLYPRGLARLLQHIAPAIVHSHSGVWLKVSRAASLARVPVTIHTEHGRASPDPLSARLVDHIASRRTDMVVAVSEAVGQVLRSSVIARGTPVEVILNGVDVSRFRPCSGQGDLRAELGIPAATQILGSIGRLEAIKNHELAIGALARMATTPKPVLLLAGEGSERTKLEALAARLGVGDRVRILGWRDDVERLHATFDVFTLPSKSEGTSISLLEAMSAGLSVVATDVGGNRIVLGPEVEHQLVPSESIEALANAWDLLLGSPALRRELGSRNRERVSTHFSVERMIQSYGMLYTRLASLGKQ